MNPVHVKILQWALCQLFGTTKGKSITAQLTTGPFSELLKNTDPTMFTGLRLTARGGRPHGLANGAIKTPDNFNDPLER